MFDAVSDFFLMGGDFMYAVAAVAALILFIAINHWRVMRNTTGVPDNPGRGVRRLPALGCLALMLGVLGTIMGLCMGFSCCCLVENRAAFLAKHISEVMHCTLFGLSIAIVALVLHGLCRFHRWPGPALWESKRHSVMMRAPVVSLLGMLAVFLAMGMSMNPRQVRVMPVRFERESMNRRALDYHLTVAPDGYTLCTPDGARLEISRGDFWLVSRTLEIEFRDSAPISAFVQCDDAIRLQELVDVLDACRAVGLSDIRIMDS